MKLEFREDLPVPKFKARYLKKGMELLITVNALIYDIQGAGRKGIIIYIKLCNVAVLKDVNVASSDRSPGGSRHCCDHGGRSALT